MSHGQAVWQGQFAAGSYGGSESDSIHRDDLGNAKETKEWQSLQYRTFLRWTNHVLGKRALKIDDLEGGLQDGLMLQALLEVLSEKSVRGVQRRARMRVQMINNHFVLFTFMKAEGLRIENIGPEDIVDQDTKLLLGLIWILILRYTIGRHLTTNDNNCNNDTTSTKDSSSRSGSAPSAPTSAAARLLSNLQLRLAPTSPQIPSFPTLAAALADGRPLLGLVHSKRPDLISLVGMDAKSPEERLKQAFDALGALGAPLLLDPEDLQSADDKSLMTFLSPVLDALDSSHPAAAAAAGVPRAKQESVSNFLGALNNSPRSAAPIAVAPSVSGEFDDLILSLGDDSASKSKPTPPPNDASLGALDSLIGSLAAPAPLPRPNQSPRQTTPPSSTSTDDSLGALDSLIGSLASPSPRNPSTHPPPSSNDVSLDALDALIGGLASQPSPRSPTVVTVTAPAAPPLSKDPSLGALDALIGGLASSPSPRSPPTTVVQPSTRSPPTVVVQPSPRAHTTGATSPPLGPPSPRGHATLTEASPSTDASLNALDALIGGLASPHQQPHASPRVTTTTTSSPAASPRYTSPRGATAPPPVDERDQFDDLQDIIDRFPALANVSPLIRGIPANLRNFSDGLDSIDETESTPAKALRRFDPTAFLQIIVQTIGAPVRSIIAELEERGRVNHADSLRASLSNLLVAAKALSDLAGQDVRVPEIGDARDQVLHRFPPLVEALRRCLESLAQRATSPVPSLRLTPPTQAPTQTPTPLAATTTTTTTILSPRIPAQSPRSARSGVTTVVSLLESPRQAANDADNILKKIKAMLEEIKAGMPLITDINDFNELQAALAVVVQNTNKFVDALNNARLTSSDCENLGRSLVDLDRVWNRVMSRAGQSPRSPRSPTTTTSADAGPTASEALQKVLQNPTLVQNNAEAIIAQLKQILLEAQVARDGLDEPDAQEVVNNALQHFATSFRQFLLEVNGTLQAVTINDLVHSLQQLEKALQQAQQMCRKHCSMCKKEILGSYARLGDRAIHSTCFVCSVCRTPLSRYVEKDGRLFCPDHNPGSGLVCAACRQPITAKYLEVEGKTLHPECMKCSKCRGPVSGRFFLVNGQTMCEKCGSAV